MFVIKTPDKHPESRGAFIYVKTISPDHVSYTSRKILAQQFSQSEADEWLDNLRQRSGKPFEIEKAEE